MEQLLPPRVSVCCRGVKLGWLLRALLEEGGRARAPGRCLRLAGGRFGAKVEIWKMGRELEGGG